MPFTLRYHARKQSQPTWRIFVTLVSTAKGDFLGKQKWRVFTEENQQLEFPEHVQSMELGKVTMIYVRATFNFSFFDIPLYWLVQRDHYIYAYIGLWLFLYKRVILHPQYTANNQGVWSPTHMISWHPHLHPLQLLERIHQNWSMFEVKTNNKRVTKVPSRELTYPFPNIYVWVDDFPSLPRWDMDSFPSG